MTNIECNNIADTTGELVTISDIVDALKIERETVHSNILAYVEHKKVGTKIMVNKTSLSDWLMGNATFSRQTIIVPKSELEDYKSKFTAKHPNDIFKENPRKNKRSVLPFRTTKPFDVLEKAEQGKLLYPQVLVREKKYNDTEALYRDMFSSGAIKIKLGQRKTFFYVPEDVPKDEGVLCPAIDEVIKESPKKEPFREIKTLDGMVIIKGDPIITKSVKNLLNRHYRIKSTKNEEESLEVEISKQFQSVDGVIVTRLHFV